MNIQHDIDNSIFRLDVFSGKPDLQYYIKQGGYEALKRAFASNPKQIIEEIKNSGLRGRGGAAFSTGTKMEMVIQNAETQRYIICNADEGEPGTFKDRFIMTHIPFQLLEGMVISAYAVGATQGYIYIRHEYYEVQEILRESIDIARKAGLLGENILNSGFSFDLSIFSGAGSYLCGEETALLSSIEGKKGRPRLKPPYPTQCGLWSKPTLINNVETLGNIAPIIRRGAEWYKKIGTADSQGTKLISLSGDVEKRGLYEVPFGTTFREIVENYGGGMRKGSCLKAVNIGGASGVVVPAEELDCPLEYKNCAARGITIGSGALFVMDETRSLIANIRNRVEFFIHESCGKCTPCREGLRQAQKIINKIIAGQAELSDIANLERYTRTMQQTAFCGLGQAAGNGLISSLSYFRREYEEACTDYPALLTKEETA